ncbi:MAG: TolC family protein [Pseudomonadota bacterium]
MRQISLKICAMLCALVTGACVSPVPESLRAANGETRWVRAVDSDATGEVSEAWLTTLGDAELEATIGQALSNNYALAQAAARMEQAWFTLKTTRAASLPAVSLTLDSSRRRIGAGPQNNNFGGSAGGEPIDVFGLGLDIVWQADIWRELSAANRSAALTYAAAEAAYLDQRRRLVASVARNWFALAAARAQVEVAALRVANAKDSLEIVESGYRSGINEALDLYLARNTLANAENNLAASEQIVAETEATYQLLRANYPGTPVEATPTLRDVDQRPQLGLPATLVTRRADLQQAWLNLLAANADLAVAHKQRFPSITLRAGSSDSADLFPDVFDGTPLGWTLIGTVIQPVWEAGRLRANTDRARARMRELEYLYLEAANQAFAEVENAISQHDALALRIGAAQQGLVDAESALRLSLEQYQSGLVNYATVLESQRRAFDARATMVDLRNQRLQNRVDLFEALGGAYNGSDHMDAKL